MALLRRCIMLLLSMTLSLLWLVGAKSIDNGSSNAAAVAAGSSSAMIVLPNKVRAPFVICRFCHNEILDMGMPSFFAEDEPLALWIAASTAADSDASDSRFAMINYWEPVQMALGSLRHWMAQGIRQAVAEDMLLV